MADNEIVIRELLAYAREHLGESLSVEGLAAKAGYSQSHLRFIFRSATGQSLLHHLLEMRIDRAKKLLGNTRLSVSEVAFEVGFANHNQFSRLFRKKVGCSPVEFRRRAPDSAAVQKQTADWKTAAEGRQVHEPLRGKDWNPRFEVITGEWQQEQEFLSGLSDEDSRLAYLEPLPENFRLSFEARPGAHSNLSSAELDILLQNQSRTADYCVFVLGRDEMTGEFRPHGFGRQLNPKGVLTRDVWHRAELELKDNTLRLLVNGSELFTYRDAFPPPFSSRSHFAVGTYHGQIQVRDLRIVDLGFRPLVRSVRQGDSLYNAGLFSLARDLYLRLLESNVSNSDIMELRYKIGRCFLEEENGVQARGWFEKVISVPEDVFWWDQARLSLLDLEIREKRFETLPNRLRELHGNPRLKNGVREIVATSAARLAECGFYDKTCSLRERLLELEEPGTYPALIIENALADNLLLLLRRFPESEARFRSVLQHPALPLQMRAFTLFSLNDCLNFQGKLDESNTCLCELETLAASFPQIRPRLHLYRAFRLRANSEIAKAIDELAKVQSVAKSNLDYWQWVSMMHSARLSCILGEIAQARAFMSKIPRIFTRIHEIWTRASIEVLQGNCETAARIFLDHSQARKSSLESAECAIEAGLIFCLAGEEQEAFRAWKWTANYYLEGRYNFFGPFAENLLRGSTENAEQMPGSADRRAEMFFYLGLLCEKQGKAERAAELFRLCAAEDLSLDLPTVLAKKKLADGLK